MIIYFDTTLFVPKKSFFLPQIKAPFATEMNLVSNERLIHSIVLLYHSIVPSQRSIQRALIP